MLENLTKLYSKFDERYSVINKKALTRWTLELPGAGCAYHKTTGGCTMCGFNNATNKYTFGGHLYPSLIFKALYNLAHKDSLNQSPEELYVYNGGSWFNDTEIPINFQNYLYKQIAGDPNIERLLVESRCEYINWNKIVTAKKLLCDKKLVVAIGLESQDDIIRNKYIKKGLSQTTFENTIRGLKEHGAQSLTYLFLKPLGVSEAAAYAEIIKSIEFCLNIGVDEINISCAFIQPNTEMADYYERGQFKPPYLWTILEIIKQIIKNDWPVSIGGFSDDPKPLAIPANCPKCSPEIYQVIETFRQTRKLEKIPVCNCHDDWKKIIA